MLSSSVLNTSHKIKATKGIGWDSSQGIRVKNGLTGNHTWDLGDYVNIHTSGSGYYLTTTPSGQWKSKVFTERELRLVLGLEDESSDNSTSNSRNTLPQVKASSNSRNTVENTNTKKDGTTTMGVNMKNLFEEFGMITDGSVALTFQGQVAVKVRENEFIRYNKENNTMENQMNMVIQDASNLIYIIPVSEVVAGDIIRVKKSYYQVTKNTATGSIVAVNIKDGSKKTMIKEVNIFGLNFFYKVVSLFSGNGITNGTTNGINPMVIMALMEGDADKSSLMPLLLMNVQGGTGTGAAIDPMMMMMMMGDKGGNGMQDMLMMQMMMGGNQAAGAGIAGMNPMMMMMMMMGDKGGSKGGSGINMKDMLMVQMLTGQTLGAVTAPVAPVAPVIQPVTAPRTGNRRAPIANTVAPANVDADITPEDLIPAVGAPLTADDSIVDEE